MNDMILFFRVWALATTRQLHDRMQAVIGSDTGDGLANDAGMTTLEILLWAAAAVVAVGAIVTAIFLWLRSKSNAVTQQ